MPVRVPEEGKNRDAHEGKTDEDLE